MQDFLIKQEAYILVVQLYYIYIYIISGYVKRNKRDILVNTTLEYG